ncbi:MAG TPA: dihydrolipoamide acetyltransferase family protein [Candidatus Elarobacter sp.]|nr:dihydrolipoamide acetyltransferase family protein [Candidatus Elarobacter sp.]
MELTLADIGEGLAEAEIVEWLVRPGDVVRADQPVVVVMTDKASVEIPAPAGGVVRECVGAPGDVVPVGAVLLRLDAPGAANGTAPAQRPPAPQAAPSTRRRASELGVDLRRVAGTGPGGRVTTDDVERHAAGSGAPPAQRDDALMPLRGLRRATAHAVSEAWRTIPPMTEFRDVDASELVRVRAAVVARRGAGAAPFTYLPFFVRAVARALARHRGFNASYDAHRDAVRAHATCDVGIVVATDHGLVVPVVHDAARPNLDALAAQLDRLTADARAGRLAAAELGRAAVTITNYGSYGTTAGIPIVRPGESAIVGFGRIRDAVVAIGGTPAVRPLLTITVVADHRLNDGRELAAFTSSIAEGCRAPDEGETSA